MRFSFSFNMRGNGRSYLKWYHVMKFKQFFIIFNSIIYLYHSKKNHPENINFHMQMNIKVLTENTITILCKKGNRLIRVYDTVLHQHCVMVIYNKLKPNCSADFSQKHHFILVYVWDDQYTSMENSFHSQASSTHMRFYLKILPAYDKSHMLPLFFGLDDVVCPCLFSNGNFRNIQLPWFCPGVFLWRPHICSGTVSRASSMLLSGFTFFGFSLWVLTASMLRLTNSTLQP